MFTEFEKEFLKINQMKKFDLWFWRTCFLTTLINLLLKIFFKIKTTFTSIYEKENHKEKQKKYENF